KGLIRAYRPAVAEIACSQPSDNSPNVIKTSSNGVTRVTLAVKSTENIGFSEFANKISLAASADGGCTGRGHLAWPESRRAAVTAPTGNPAPIETRWGADGPGAALPGRPDTVTATRLRRLNPLTGSSSTASAG
ncbi:hypothetical protein ACH442_43400, partial [Actinoplanes sp. NPDC020271]